MVNSRDFNGFSNDFNGIFRGMSPWKKHEKNTKKSHEKSINL